MGKLLASIACLLVFAPSAAAVPGDLDRMFGENGKVVHEFQDTSTALNAVTQDDDGVLVTVAQASKVKFKGRISFGSDDYLIVRLLPGGSLDQQFGVGGRIELGQYLRPSDLRVAAGGRIYVLVHNKRTGNQDLLAFTRDGIPDLGFSGNGVLSDEELPSDFKTLGFTMRRDGRPLLTGGLVGVNQLSVPTIVSLMTDGQLDTAFGSNGMHVDQTGALGFRSVAIAELSDGSIVQGSFVNAKSTTSEAQIRIAKYSSIGEPVATFGTGGQILFPARWPYQRASSLVASSSSGFAATFQGTYPTTGPSRGGDIFTTNHYSAEGTYAGPGTGYEHHRALIGGGFAAVGNHSFWSIGRYLSGTFYGSGRPGSSTKFRAGIGIAGTGRDVAELPDGSLVLVGTGCRTMCHFAAARILTSDGGDPAPLAFVDHPSESKYFGKVVTRISGTATPRGMLNRVRVSVQRINGADRKRGRCWWLSKDRKKFVKRRASKLKKCDRPLFMPVGGVENWKVDLRRALPRGSYVVSARAVRKDGLFNPFNNDADSRVSFVVGSKSRRR